MDLSPFKDVIKGKCGLCFDESRAVTLAEGISARMSEKSMDSCVEYLSLLTNDDDEFHELVNLLTVNETYFYREPVHISLLVEKIIPVMLREKRPGKKIRILSSGCSTGEEPYSLVMALIEKYGPGIMNSVSVTGADIDSDAIGKALKGVYYPHSFRGFDQGLREKYFESAENNLYRVKDIVRQNVGFGRLNLLSETYPEELAGADVIFYRNVSIYFEPQTQKNIFKKMAGLLNENGYLFVSSTETLSHDFGILSLVEMDGIFIYHKKNGLEVEDRRKSSITPTEEARKVTGKTTAPGTISKKTKASRTSPIVSSQGTPSNKGLLIAKNAAVADNDTERRKESHVLFDEALSLAKNKKYEDALNMLDKLIEQEGSFIKAYMLKAGILINLKMPDEAEEVCLKSIGLDRWCLEGYLLLGLVAKIRNDEDTSMKRFKEALYIQSSCWPAHFYLAEMYRGRGELEKACREYEIISNLLKKDDLKDHGLTFFPLSFPVEQVVHLCEHNLSRLREQLK